MHIVIVSGMLGVGKTSIILRFIEHLSKGNHRTVVIENDFGPIGVDAEVIRRNGLEVRDLKGGCVCCTLKSNLIGEIKDLQTTFAPGTVIIEPTGIADPEYILTSLDNVPGVNIDKVSVVVVLDCERFLRMKRMFERPLKNQFKAATLVVMNKNDTVNDRDRAEIENSIRAYSYAGRIVRASADKGDGIGAVLESVFG